MKMTREFIIIYTTFPDLKTAKKITNMLVKAKLIACGNIFKIFSIYKWQGQIEKRPEYGAFIKTAKKNYKKVEEYIKNNHPYEVPEIIFWAIEKGYKPYLDWIRESISAGRFT